jgi:hypothetical protein
LEDARTYFGGRGEGRLIYPPDGPIEMLMMTRDGETPIDAALDETAIKSNRF